MQLYPILYLIFSGFAPGQDTVMRRPDPIAIKKKPFMLLGKSKELSREVRR